MRYSGLPTLLGFIEETAGIQLGLDKEDFLRQRLEPLLERYQSLNYQDLISLARRDNLGKMRQEIIDAVTINETSFFRDSSPFDLFTETILPKVAQRKREMGGDEIEVLCAGCSSGQETYSLAICAARSEALRQHMKIRFVGVDINQRVISYAHRGFYSDLEVSRGLSNETLQRFFVRASGGWNVGPELKSMVSFSHANLLEPGFHSGIFDIVFCRNILIYFCDAKHDQIVENISRHMAPRAVLLLGSTEILDTKNSRFERQGTGGRVFYELKG